MIFLCIHHSTSINQESNIFLYRKRNNNKSVSSSNNNLKNLENLKNPVPPIIEKPKNKFKVNKETNQVLSLRDNERVINTVDRIDSMDLNSTGYNSMARSRQTFYKINKN